MNNRIRLIPTHRQSKTIHRLPFKLRAMFLFQPLPNPSIYKRRHKFQFLHIYLNRIFAIRIRLNPPNRIQSQLNLSRIRQFRRYNSFLPHFIHFLLLLNNCLHTFIASLSSFLQNLISLGLVLLSSLRKWLETRLCGGSGDNWSSKPMLRQNGCSVKNI